MAEGTVLHTVVREHLETFLRQAADRTDGVGLPRFVEQEFREFLTCGVLARGFARVRCEGCAFERLVPFSCKGRGFCPSCGGRRMAERAAHLVDEVLPRVPVRQWVLTVPHRVRYPRSLGSSGRFSSTWACLPRSRSHTPGAHFQTSGTSSPTTPPPDTRC